MVLRPPGRALGPRLKAGRGCLGARKAKERTVRPPHAGGCAHVENQSAANKTRDSNPLIDPGLVGIQCVGDAVPVGVVHRGAPAADTGLLNPQPRL